MKILFITSSDQDYLADSLFHGLRVIYGKNCIDYPKCEFLYKNFNPGSNYIYGKGFTLYSGLLEDIEIDRINIDSKIKTNYFDLIIISNIQRQFGWFVQYRPWLTPQNTIIIDGDDTPLPYPMRGFWLKRPYYWFLPRIPSKFLYFKREWTSETNFSLFSRLLPKGILSYLPRPKNLRKISFSIPEEKIIKTLPIKKKKFPKHIVDEDLNKIVPESNVIYSFDSEEAYYNDLQESSFGITTKRAGWDCLRHYEIAANGGVLCFKNLQLKPDNCAPHGLSEENTIIYTDSSDLFNQISTLREEDYLRFQEQALKWVKEQTTEKRAEYLISTFYLHKKVEK